MIENKNQLYRNAAGAKFSKRSLGNPANNGSSAPVKMIANGGRTDIPLQKKIGGKPSGWPVQGVKINQPAQPPMPIQRPMPQYPPIGMPQMAGMQPPMMMQSPAMMQRPMVTPMPMVQAPPRPQQIPPWMLQPIPQVPGMPPRMM